MKYENSSGKAATTIGPGSSPLSGTGCMENLDLTPGILFSRLRISIQLSIRPLSIMILKLRECNVRGVRAVRVSGNSRAESRRKIKSLHCLYSIPDTTPNADAMGTGPSVRVRIGKKVAYERTSCMHWLRQRLSACYRSSPPGLTPAMI